MADERVQSSGAGILSEVCRIWYEETKEAQRVFLPKILGFSQPEGTH